MSWTPYFVGPAPQITLSTSVLDRIMNSIGARPAETGGILLGPLDSNDVTDFYYDGTADCTGITYTPDVKTLQQKLNDEWLPAGVDFKGFVHSHPTALDRPSGGDLEFIARLLRSNPDMPHFVAPIVIPEEFRIRFYLIDRNYPSSPREAEVRLI